MKRMNCFLELKTFSTEFKILFEFNISDFSFRGKICNSNNEVCFGTDTPGNEIYGSAHEALVKCLYRERFEIWVYAGPNQRVYGNCQAEK